MDYLSAWTRHEGEEMLASSGIKKIFENNWEKMILWTMLIGLFYLLKSFFLLIFETFLITYTTKSAVEWIVSRFNLNYRLTTIMVFVLCVGLLGSTVAWVGPKLVLESNQILTDFANDGDQQTKEKTNRFVEKVVLAFVGEEKAQAVIGSPEYIAVMTTIKTEAAKAIKAALPRILEILLRLVKFGWELLISLLLAIVFSFILVMDWQKIASRMRALETSRIRTFYVGVAPHLKAFTDVLGKVFRAQALIAICNTTLTALGLWFFDVPSIALLSTLVFFCGFIPVFGLFLSSIPILLFSIQVGGLYLAFKLIAWIVVIHFVEAYVLNPKITGGVLQVHPLLILVLLLVGERFFGIWGLVVGMPIGYYVISVLTAQDENLNDKSQPHPPF